MKLFVVWLWLGCLLMRVLVAAELDLFGDEAFYWWCAQNPAPAYADHPLVTAMLVRAGTELFGDTTLGVRAFFLLGGALVPWLVLALARPIVGARSAWWAAALSLAVPMLSVTGSLATPDGPLLVFSLAVFLGLERATRSGGTRAWILAGSFAALGLATHYRFGAVMFAALIWLIATRAGRLCWRTPGPWIAGGVAALGLLPMLLFNIEQDFAPLQYQALERHGVTRGLVAWPRFLIEQGLVLTPVLFVALLAVMFRALRRGWNGDDRMALLACASAVPIGLYFLASPITDITHAYMHWPSIGYLPLLPLLPELLVGWWRAGTIGRIAAIVAPGLALASGLIVMVDAVTGSIGVAPLHRFEGWSQLADHTAGHIEERRPSLIVADNYIIASELAFELGETVYVLDNPVNDKHGRGLQFEVWGLDERALSRREDEDLLLVLEPTARGILVPERRRADVLALFEGAVLVDEYVAGRHDFEFYRAVRVADGRR